MSTKQDKVYETLRQTQANTFSDGLNMDLHPLTTPNTILTDCVNGTMITYNDNEFVLQNERGNSRIDGACLNVGFIPVAMKEYNGILYIISHNPQTKHTEIGTFPSPKKNTNSNLNEFNKNVNVNSISYYTDYEKNVTWYDYNLSVSNYDKYKLSVTNEHPLIVLEHFVLDKQGNITKITLNENNNDNDNAYRFTHVGEGILGYKYRPYFISSVATSVIPSKGVKWAQLNITTTSDDEELQKNIENVEVTHDVAVTLLSDNEDQIQIDSIEDISDNGIKSLSTTVNNWDYTYNLSSTDVINLQFKQEFVIDGNTYKYDFRRGVIVLMENDSPTNIEYNKIKFSITSKISKGDWVVNMDHLNSEIISDLQSIFTQESWFSKFQYYLSEDQSETNADEIFIDFDIELDLEAYDVNYESYTESNKGEATYKLHEIDENGNLKGIHVTNANVFTSSKMWDVVSAGNPFNGKHDLFIDENKGLNYLKSDVIMPVQNVTSTETCDQLKLQNNTPKYVRYVKENNETYNIVLYDGDRKIVSKTNIFGTLNGSQCGNDMEEYFEPGFLNYSAKHVKVRRNKIYLFELTFNVLNISENKWKKEYVSFIVVTANKMLDPNFGLKHDRMDEILLNDWFGRPYDINKIINSAPYYWTKAFPNKYKNNRIDLNILDSKTVGEIPFYAKKFFLKYNSLFPSEGQEWIPSIYQRINSKFAFNNKSDFNCKVKLEEFIDLDINKNGSIDYDYTFDKKISLSGNATEYNQTVERKYLWDLFKNDEWEIPLKSASAYYVNDGIDSIKTDIIMLTSPYGYYSGRIIGTISNNWLTDTSIRTRTCKSIVKRKGKCYEWLGDWSSTNVTAYCTNDTPSSLFAAPSTLMQSVGLGRGMNFSKIKETDSYVKYSQNNKEKIWTHCKLNKTYVLMGIDSLNNSVDSRLAYTAILKHGYYLNDINKIVYQYTYDKEDIQNDSGEIIGSQIVIDEEIPTIPEIIGRLFPSQCIFIDKDYSSYNIQSYNNLNYNNLQNVNSSIYEGENSITFKEFDEKYIIFLRELGDCLNRFYISNDVLQQDNNSSLYFDYDSELFDNDPMSYNLFNKDIENLESDTDFFMPLKNINNPHLKYDKENNILYTDKIEEDQINQFEYTGGDCVAPLKWNYSLTFDEFWNDISVDSIDKLNKYYSLLFYRYSSYAEEQ